jgi:hypothetical protein
MGFVTIFQVPKGVVGELGNTGLCCSYSKLDSFSEGPSMKSFDCDTRHSSLITGPLFYQSALNAEPVNIWRDCGTEEWTARSLPSQDVCILNALHPGERHLAPFRQGNCYPSAFTNMHVTETDAFSSFKRINQLESIKREVRNKKGHRYVLYLFEYNLIITQSKI